MRESCNCYFGGMGGSPERKKVRCIIHVHATKGCDSPSCICHDSPKPLGMIGGAIIHSMTPISAMSGGGGSSVSTDISNAIKADRTALLAKLCDEVEGLQLKHECNGDDEIELQKTVSFNHALKQVLALLEKAGE